jgi:protein-disulfide isomerase
VVVAVAAAVSSSGGEPAAPPEPAQASTLFDGIEERDGVLGDPDAPLTVTEYVDLQCPVCAVASKETLPTLIDDYVRTGKVKLDVRTLHFLGPDSVRAAAVAAGAEQQGKLWPFLEAFYSAQGQENSGYVTDAFLRDVSAAAGVDADKALAAADTAGAQDRLNRANRDAQALGINSTPTFTVARGDGNAQVLAAGAQDPQTLAAELDKALAK